MRIPSLDGLRAVSISMVLFAHLWGTQNYPIGRFHQVDLGTLGVRVFFVISGYLITYLLLKEWDKTGRISLKNFYFRRTFRIFPAYYTLVAVIALLAAFGMADVTGRDLLHAATYTINYHKDPSWLVGHAWTLAVEEQFYLIWPAVLLLAGGARGAARVALAFVLIAPLVRVAVLVIPDLPFGLPYYYGRSFETVGDAIGVGCLLAIFRTRLREWVPYRRLLSSPWFVLVPAVGLAAASLDGWYNVATPEMHQRLRILHGLVGVTVLNVAIVTTMDWTIRYHEGRVGRFLNHPILVRVGLWSYSLYLWQQVFLNRHSTAPWAAFPLNIVLVFVAAILSYNLVEKPFLKLRERLGGGLQLWRARRRAAKSEVAARS